MPKANTLLRRVSEATHVTRRKTHLRAVPAIRQPVRMEISVDKLFIDQTYGAQRPLNAAWVAAHKGENYDATLMRELEVSAREQGESAGRFAVLDGQHRLALAIAMDVRSLQCKVHFGLTPEMESWKFLGLNDQRTPSLAQKFASRVRGNDERAVAIFKVLQDAGYTMGGQGKMGIRQGTATIEHIYDDPELGVGTLGRAAFIAAHSWKELKPTVTGIALAAIALCLRAGRGHIDESGLRKVLSKHGPDTIMAKVTEDLKGLKLRADAKPMAMARQILKYYGHGRHRNKVELSKLDQRRNNFWL